MAVPYPSTGVPIKLETPLMSNNNIIMVQTQLIKKGISCGPQGIDGIYGVNTYEAVKTFQSMSGLNVNGVVDKTTWDRLFSGVITVTKTSDMLFDTIISDKLKWVFEDRLTGFSVDNIPDDIDDKFSSYIINLATRRWMPLPVIPEQLSEQLAAVWGDTNVMGRSASFKSYQGTSNRNINFTLKLHTDLLHELSLRYSVDITNIVDFLKSLVYPEYEASQIRPPVCILKLADVVKIRGICTSVNPSYTLPIKEIIYGKYKGQKKYSMVEVGLSFTEVPIKAPSSKEIHGGKDFVYGG